MAQTLTLDPVLCSQIFFSGNLEEEIVLEVR